MKKGLILALTCSSLVVVGAFNFSCREPQSKERNLRIVGVYNTSTKEPWVKAIHQAIDQVKGDSSYESKDSVPQADFAKAVETAAQQADIVIGDGFADEAGVRNVARNFPKVQFVFGSGLGPSEPNFSVFDNWIHEPAYLAGMVAAKLSKSGIIGAVGGKPVPEVNRLINAFFAGAHDTNPHIRTKAVFINSWHDLAAAAKAANALGDAGVDVIYAERDGVIGACDQRGIPCFGNLLDQNAESTQVVGSVTWSLDATISEVISTFRLAGQPKAIDLGEYSRLAKKGSAFVISPAWKNKIQSIVGEQLTKKEEQIRQGEFRVDVQESTPNAK